MKINLILLALFLIGFTAFAQELPKVIPPSPTAASLGQYGAVPVSNYTGVPNIQIPIYDIKSGEINIPITISYHASGIKVSQESSSVGLGWSLNAGGVITRSVLGVDDLRPIFGYAFINDLTSTEADLPAAYQAESQQYLETSNGLRDGQPDMLYYNFLGVSGKLILGKKTSGSNVIKGIPLEQTNIQFAYYLDDKKWEVTDSKGWKYWFNVKEMSVNHNSRESYYPNDPALYGNGRFLFNVDRMDVLNNVNLSDIFVSSWYLNKIVTPNGDEVLFEYDQDMQYKGISQMSYYEQESLNGNPLVSGGDPSVTMVENLWHGFFNEYKYGVTANMQSFDNVNLKKIIFNNGYVEFKTSDREDVRAQYFMGQYYPKPQKIDSFEVFDKLNRSIKKILFSYSYFNQNTSGNNKENYWRLKLDRVQEFFFDQGTGGYISKPPYVLTYNSPQLPSKTSTSIDHWGFYNGADNDRIPNYGDMTSQLYDAEGNYNLPVIVNDNVPSDNGMYKYYMPLQIECGPSSVSTRYPFLNGAYREPDGQKMQAGMLTQINYPTGGFTRFTYSPNEYIAPTDVNFYRYERNRFSLWHEGVGDAQSKQFTLNYYTIVKIDCQISNNGSANELANVQALIKKTTGENVILFRPSGNDFWKRVQLILPPGSYEAFVKTNASSSIVDINMAVEFVQQFWTDGTYNRIGGGLRLAQQEDLDASGDVIKKRIYEYQTGKAMTEIQHFYKDVGFNINPFSSPDANTLAGNVIVRSSNTETLLSSSAMGNFVGYTKVSVSDVDQLGNALGKTEYYYDNEPDEKGNGIFNLPGFPVTTHTSNGNLLKENVYNNAGGIVKTKEVQYHKDETTAIIVKGIYSRTPLKAPTNSSSGFNPMFRFYRIYSEWRYTKKEIETVFSTSGGSPIITTIEYQFDNSAHKNLTFLKKGDSKGRILKTKYQYPHDLVNIEQTPLMQNLVNQNIISQPVVTEIFVDDDKTSETHVKFENSARTSNITLPVEIHAQYGGGNINLSQDEHLKIVYYKYDGSGNPLEVGSSDNTHIVYLWGYNHEYPVAEIKNITYEQVKSVLGIATPFVDLGAGSLSLTQVNTLRANLPNAMITTYTYIPLVGLSTMTDANGITTYYEYDALNRLKAIKDKDGNVVKAISYNYKTQ